MLSLGGDGTFLKTASMIKNRQMPILGVNTDPQRSVGCLCNRKVFHATCDDDILKDVLDHEVEANQVAKNYHSGKFDPFMMSLMDKKSKKNNLGKRSRTVDRV